jgi:hypothetical protein
MRLAYTGIVASGPDSGIGAVSAFLPARYSVAACESLLRPGDAALDYSFCYRDLPATLASLQVATSLSPELNSTRWTEIRRQLARWARLAPETGSSAVWVEIDDAGSGNWRPFLVHTLAELSEDDGEVRAKRTRSLTATALELSVEDPLLEGLDALVRRLPPWCAVRHVALRPTEGARLLRAICRMPITQASRFASGGKDSAGGRAIDNLVARVHSESVVTNVNFDVTPALGPRIGVEFQMAGAPSDDPRWHRLFDALEELGLLCPNKRTALCDWATPLARRNAAAPESVIRDLLVKVDFNEERAYQAKAYLPFATVGTIAQISRRS